MTVPQILNYKLSRYLRWKEKDNTVALFHELHPEPVFVSKDKFHQIQNDFSNVDLTLANELLSKGLLIESNNDDDQVFENSKVNLEQRLDRASILYLVLIRGCNFTCSYCPIPSLEKQYGQVTMSPITAVTAINYWARCIQIDYDPDIPYFIIFYGGEPLLNKEALLVGLEHVSFLQNLGKLPKRNVNLMISTNGVLIDDDIISIFKKYQMMVVIGCDGPEEYHDQIRRSIEDRPTFRIVEQAIKRLVQSGVRTFASAAITPHNIQAIKRFSIFYKQLGIEKFGFNFLRGKLLFSLIPQEKLSSYIEDATNGVLENFRNQNDPHYEAQMDRKYTAYCDKNFFPVDCNGYGNQLVIQPNGQIGNCPFLANDMGNIHTIGDSFRIKDVTIAREWRKRLPLYNSDCHDCEAKSICGGGCAWNAQEIKGDFYALDDAMCSLTKKAFDFFIWCDFERMQNERKSFFTA